jgi:hypothetical protein
MPPVGRAPSLGAVAVAVWAAGGVTSFATAFVAAAAVLHDPPAAQSTTLLVFYLAGGLVVGTALGAALVLAILSFDASGEMTYARAFCALLAGKLAGVFLLLAIGQATAGTDPGSALLPLASLAFVPVGSIGLVVSIWILMTPPRQTQASRRDAGSLLISLATAT